MYISHHIILGIIFSVILFLVIPQVGLIEAGLIFFASFLIDFDHYLYYGIKNKDWNLKRAYKRSMKTSKKYRSFSREKRNKLYCGYYFLHGMETLLVLFFLSYLVSVYFFFIFVGVTFHLLTDILTGLMITDRNDKISAIYDYYKYKKLKFFKA